MKLFLTTSDLIWKGKTMSETPHEDYDVDLDNPDDDTTGYEHDDGAEGDFASVASDEDFEEPEDE
jgi:hypothetical protein